MITKWFSTVPAKILITEWATFEKPKKGPKTTSTTYSLTKNKEWANEFWKYKVKTPVKAPESFKMSNAVILKLVCTLALPGILKNQMPISHSQIFWFKWYWSALASGFLKVPPADSNAQPSLGTAGLTKPSFSVLLPHLQIHTVIYNFYLTFITV